MAHLPPLPFYQKHAEPPPFLQHPYLRYESTDLLSALFSECRTEEQATEVVEEFRDLCGVNPDDDHTLLMWLVVAVRPKARSGCVAASAAQARCGGLVLT